jgi:hypothetical protein
MRSEHHDARRDTSQTNTPEEPSSMHHSAARALARDEGEGTDGDARAAGAQGEPGCSAVGKCGTRECASTVCVLRKRDARFTMAEDPKQRTTAEIALEMNATSHHIASSVPSPARAIALLNDLRRTNDDLREKLGRHRENEADGTRSPRLEALAHARDRAKIAAAPKTPLN